MSKYLHDLIAQGEHQNQDFKFAINNSKKIAKSLSAFANTDGGRLLIGVKDNGRIAGIKSDEEFYMVEAAAKIYCKPPITFQTKQWQVVGKTVLEINIEASNNKPHFAKDENGKWMAYIRVDDENFLAHKIQLEVWKKEKNPKGVYFSYTDSERFLIEYLQKNKTITFSKFIRLATITRKRAEDILSNFVRIDIITINTIQNGTTFSLNNDFDTDELEKFAKN